MKHYSLHLTDKETKDEKGLVSCSRSQIKTGIQMLVCLNFNWILFPWNHTLRHSLIVYTALCYHYSFKYLSLPLKGCSSKTGKVTPSLHPSNTQQCLLYNDLKALLNIQFMVLQHYFPLITLLQPNIYEAIFTVMGKHNSLEYRLCNQID